MSGDTIHAVLRAAANRLRAAGSETARLDAEVLLRHLLGSDRTRLYADFAEPLPARTRAVYDALIDRRAAGEPVAYLTGTREFMGLPLTVGPGVLVPRPETECLVEWVVGWIQSGRPDADQVRIADVGTGSGAIALALAHLLPRARIAAVERSPRALGFARQNRNRLGLADQVVLVRGDLLQPLGPVNVIVANLPYLRPAQLHPGLAHEPVEALVGGADGLDPYRALLPEAAQRLIQPGLFAAEIDPAQVTVMVGLCRATFPGARIAIERDLAGRDRFVTVQQ